MSKIQFWKQFTTAYFNSISVRSCYWYVKDTILKAIHNNFKNIQTKLKVVTDMSKIQFWKQFTTVRLFLERWRKLLLICQRYNFESNSQRSYRMRSALLVVTDMSKIQFWKQFTTTTGERQIFGTLLLICQRYNFESNSQRMIGKLKQLESCYWYVKDTILKAIHNT